MDFRRTKTENQKVKNGIIITKQCWRRSSSYNIITFSPVTAAYWWNCNNTLGIGRSSVNFVLWGMLHIKAETHKTMSTLFCSIHRSQFFVFFYFLFLNSLGCLLFMHVNKCEQSVVARKPFHSNCMNYILLCFVCATLQNADANYSTVKLSKLPTIFPPSSVNPLLSTKWSAAIFVNASHVHCARLSSAEQILNPKQTTCARYVTIPATTTVASPWT